MLLKEMKSINPPHILVYGEPGSGKTILGLSGGSSVLCIDIDGGLRSGLTLQDKFTNQRLEVEVKDCVEHNPKRPTAFDKAVSYIESFAKSPSKPILMIDSLTMLSEACIAKVSFENNRLGKSLYEAHWGIIIRHMENLIWTLKAIPVVVYMSAHQMYYEVPTEGENNLTKTTVMISGKKLPSKIIASFDELWYLKPRNIGSKVEIEIQAFSSSLVTARTRSQLSLGILTSEGLVSILRRIGYDLEKGEGKNALS